MPFCLTHQRNVGLCECMYNTTTTVEPSHAGSSERPSVLISGVLFNYRFHILRCPHFFNLWVLCPGYRGVLIFYLWVLCPDIEVSSFQGVHVVCIIVSSYFIASSSDSRRFKGK